MFGYNIYLSEQSLKDKFSRREKESPDPHNFAPYPGDTDGDRNRESYEITHLENGRAYFVSVRTLGPNGLESEPSNEVQFVTLAGGTFVISSSHSAENGGFEFDTSRSCPARDSLCDIYLYAKNEDVGLSSPNRLGAGLRQTWFGKPGIVYLKEMDTIKIQRGDRITSSSMRGRAELTILKIERRGGEAEATIEYVYYPSE